MDIGNSQITYGGKSQESALNKSEDLQSYLEQSTDFQQQLEDMISAINHTTFSYIQGKEDEQGAWEALLQQIDDYVEASGEQMDERVQEQLEERWNLGQLAKEFIQETSLL